MKTFNFIHCVVCQLKFSAMFKAVSLIAFILIASISVAQDMKNFKLYKPEENAVEALNTAIARAKKDNKHVFVQIGGNWCVWCARFNDFITKDVQLDSLVRANYIVYHLNYSKENYNRDLLKRFGFPQRFGFPVFIVLDGNGKQLHTQNSAYLETGKGSDGYNRDYVVDFFRNWAPAALDEKQYKNY